MALTLVASDNMAETLLDTFLENHVPNVGSSWGVSLNSTMTVKGLLADYLLPATNANVRTGFEKSNIGSDQMVIRADCGLFNTAGGNRAGVTARHGSNHNDYYAAYFDGVAATSYAFTLVKNVSGSTTTLATSNYNVSTVGTLINIRLDALVGLVVYLANSASAFLTNADATITGINFGGVYGRNATPRIANFISQLSSGITTTAVIPDQSFIFFMS